MKKNDETTDVKSRDKAQILNNQAVFQDKFSDYEKNPIIKLADFFHYKSSGIMFDILSDFHQNLSMGF